MFKATGNWLVITTNARKSFHPHLISVAVTIGFNLYDGSIMLHVHEPNDSVLTMKDGNSANGTPVSAPSHHELCLVI